jgi:microcystin-dependent protein
MAILRPDFVSGTLSADLPQSGGGSGTMQSPGLQQLGTVASPDVVRVVLDPFGINGRPESVDITAHTAGSNSATVLRQQRGTQARLHPASTVFIVAPVGQDFIDFQAQLDNQFQKTIYTTKGDMLVATGNATPVRVGIGADYQAWTADSAQAAGGRYRAIPFLCTSGSRPASNLFVGLHIFETDTLHTLVCTNTVGPVWQYVDAVPGTVAIDATDNNLPAGWLWCDGSAVSRTTYAALFARIGTDHGVGDGATTFNLPDMRERVPVGWDSNGGVTRVTNGGIVGSNGGAEAKVLDITNMPSHDHAEVGTGWGTDTRGAHVHDIGTNPAGGHNHGGATFNNGGHNHRVDITVMRSIGALQHQHTDGGNVAVAPTGGLAATDVHLTSDTVANHVHGIPAEGDHVHTGTTDSSGGHRHVVVAQGGGQGFSTMPPYLVMPYRIRI